MKQCFVDKRFSSDRLDVIEQANIIIRDYTRQGFDLTVRQLYYQFIARDLFPDTWWVNLSTGKRLKKGEHPDQHCTKNHDMNYNRLQAILNDGRLAGLIDWASMVDRTRQLSRHSAWDGVEDILRSCEHSFQLNPWDDQLAYVEVWVEKEALMGVIGNVCNQYRVPYMACRGYTSQSAAYQAARRFATKGYKECILLHLGDHDPSGVDMTRDNSDRLDMLRGQAEVRRLALNLDQVDAHNPPPNPTKLSDTRTNSYTEQYGTDCWELDALEPAVIHELIETELEGIIDQGAWADTLAEEADACELLGKCADNWDGVKDFIGSD